MHVEKSEVVWPIWELVRQYDYPLLTAVATTPSLQRPDVRDTGSRPNDYICHVFAAAVPVSEVRRLRGLDIKSDAVQKVLLKIGTLTLEGTNFTTALQRELTAYYPKEEALEIAELKWQDMALREQWTQDPAVRDLMDLSYFLPALSTMRRPTVPAEQSRFYRWVVSAWLPTDDAIDFAIVDGAVYGQTMQDFLELDRKSNVRWMPVYRVTEQDTAAMDRVLMLQPPLKPMPDDAPAAPIASKNWRELQDIASPYVTGNKPLWPSFISFRLQHINELSDARLAALKELKKQGFRVSARWYGIADDINLIGIYIWPPAGLKISTETFENMRDAMP